MRKGRLESEIENGLVERMWESDEALAHYACEC